jgi:hypothetical protein
LAEAFWIVEKLHALLLGVFERPVEVWLAAISILVFLFSNLDLDTVFDSALFDEDLTLFSIALRLSGTGLL